FQYDPFPDGVHFSVLARLDAVKPEARFRVVFNEDSAPVARFTLGEFFGNAERCRFIEVNGRIYDSTLDFSAPADGYYLPGTWSSLPLPVDGVVRFWGKNRLVQYQRVSAPWGPADELDVELRTRVWRPEQ